MHLHNEKIRDSNVGFSVGLKKTKGSGTTASCYLVVKDWDRELHDKQVV